MLLTIIHKEFLLVTRDIHALLVLFLMPTAFILIMSLALQDTYQDDKARSLELGIQFAEPKNVNEPLGGQLMALQGFHVKQFSAKDSLLHSARQSEVLAAIIVPNDFLKEADSESATLKENRLQVFYAPTTPQAMRVIIESSIRKILIASRLDTLLKNLGVDSRKYEIQRQKFNGMGLIATHELYTQLSTKQPTSVQQSVPAWLIFSMFFVVISITTTFLNEKQNGTLQRLKTFPIPASFFLIGKLIPYLGINLIQTVLMFLVGIYIVPLLGGQALQLNDQFWLLIPMSLAVSITAISIALLIATLVKTTEQATTIGGLMNLLLGAIGGIMVPTFVMPEFMQNIAALSPMNWGLEGFLTILLRDGDIYSILPEIGKLLILSVVVFAIAIKSYQFTNR